MTSINFRLHEITDERGLILRGVPITTEPQFSECTYEMFGKLMTYVAEARENCPTLSAEEAVVPFHVPVLRPEARRDLGSPSGSRRPLRVSRSPDSCRQNQFAETNTTCR